MLGEHERPAPVRHERGLDGGGVGAHLRERRGRDVQPHQAPARLGAQRVVGQPIGEAAQRLLVAAREERVDGGDVDGAPVPQPVLEIVGGHELAPSDAAVAPSLCLASATRSSAKSLPSVTALPSTPWRRSM